MTAAAASLDLQYEDIVEAAMRGAREVTGVFEKIRTKAKPSSFAISKAAPTPSARDQYVELLKSTALSLGKRAALEIILKQLPLGMTTGIAGAILNPIIGFFVGMALEAAIRETEIGLFFLYIDLRTSAQGRAFEKAARANQEAQKNGSPAQKEKSEKELIDTFRAFVKLTN